MLRGFDLAVITGGDVYSSEYGHDSLAYYLSLIHTAKSLNIPVALLGHSIGRFSDPVSKSAWLDACQSISFLSTRDSMTYEYLNGIQGLPVNSFVCADVAFGLSKATQYPAHRSNGLPLVALSVSAGIARWAGISLSEYTQAWLVIIRTILDDWKSKVVFIPHVQEAYGDDRIIQTTLHRQLAFDARVSIAASDLSAAEYKAIIGDADFLIAERMHAAIAGISSFVPTVLASYSLKAEGLVREAYCEDILRSSPPLYQASEYGNVSHVLAILQTAWLAQKDLKHSLESNVPKLRGRASDNFTLLEQWYSSRQGVL
jgi:colanic acid/amylovoran biosynthesis protein